MVTAMDYVAYTFTGKDCDRRYIEARTWCVKNLPVSPSHLGITYSFSIKNKNNDFIIYFHKDILEYYIQFKLMAF